MSPASTPASTTVYHGPSFPTNVLSKDATCNDVNRKRHLPFDEDGFDEHKFQRFFPAMNNNTSKQPSNTFDAPSSPGRPTSVLHYHSNSQSITFRGDDDTTIVNREVTHPLRSDFHNQFIVYREFDTDLPTITFSDVSSGEEKVLSHIILSKNQEVPCCMFVNSGRHILVYHYKKTPKHRSKNGPNFIQLLNTEHACTAMESTQLHHDLGGVASASNADKIVVWSTTGTITTFDNIESEVAFVDDEEEEDTTTEQQPPRDSSILDLSNEFHMHITHPLFYGYPVSNTAICSCAIATDGSKCAMAGKDGALRMYTADPTSSCHWTKTWLKCVFKQKEHARYDLTFAASDSAVVCHDNHNKLFVLAAESGRVLWHVQLSFRLKNFWSSEPVIVRDHAALQNEHNNNHTTVASNMPHDFYMLCLGDQGQLALFQGKHQGTEVIMRWQVSLSEKQSKATMSLAHNLVACVNTKGLITTLDASTGSTIKTQPTRANPFYMEFAHAQQPSAVPVEPAPPAI